MKKTIAILLLCCFSVCFFAACGAAEEITVKVIIGTDNGADKKLEEILFEYELTLKLKDPTVISIIKALSDEGKIAVEMDQNEKIFSINELEESTDNSVGDKPKIYSWLVTINGEDIKGEWDEVAVKDGDEVIFAYSIWIAE